MMKLISGSYSKAKDECARLFPEGYFEFSFLHVPESERFREIDRFLYESRHTLRFENEYTGNVVLDISEWNHKHLNSYFDAFLYFIKDNREKYECALIVSDRCSGELFGKLEDFFDHVEEIRTTTTSSPKKVKIGFVMEEGGAENDVRS